MAAQGVARGFRSGAQKKTALKGLESAIKGHRESIVRINKKLKSGSPTKRLLLRQLSDEKINLKLDIDNQKEFIGMKIGRKSK